MWRFHLQEHVATVKRFYIFDTPSGTTPNVYAAPHSYILVLIVYTFFLFRQELAMHDLTPV